MIFWPFSTEPKFHNRCSLFCGIKYTFRSSSSVIAPLVALSAVASITRRGLGQIPINWMILDLFGNMITFDVFIVHKISLYLYKYECIILIHCASCTASRHRSRLRRQTLKSICWVSFQKKQRAESDKNKWCRPHLLYPDSDA